MKVVIPEELKRRFKKACIDYDSNMSEVVCALVEGWLAGNFILEDDTSSPESPVEKDSQP